MPRCGRAISGPTGTSPRCAARASTPGRGSRWRSISAPRRPGTGRARMPCAWDLNAPPVGDLDVGDRFQKHGYPFGIVVNAQGERFLDEGLDFHSYTYAKYGGEILNQPGMFAWQVFDQKTVHLLRDEYRIPRITKEKADTLRGAGRAAGRRRPARAFSTRCAPSTPRRAPMCRSTRTSMTGCAPSGLAIDKTNWAQRLDTPPYEAYARDDRHHLHLRRPQDHQRRRGRGRRPARRSPASSPPARSSAGSTTTTTPAAPA